MPSTRRLTDKQLRALHACAHPSSGRGAEFWHDAAASWYGPRRTLGSLERRGLVSYDGHWAITEAGREALAANPRGEWV